MSETKNRTPIGCQIVITPEAPYIKPGTNHFDTANAHYVKAEHLRDQITRHIDNPGEIELVYVYCERDDEGGGVDESDLSAVQTQMKLAEQRRGNAEAEYDRWQAVASKLKASKILDEAAAKAGAPL